MSKRDSGDASHNDDFSDDLGDDELIKAEFESIVEGLSLDESSPTTYLDELDSMVDQNRFTPPVVPKKSMKEEIRGAIRAITRWKNNPRDDRPEDGAAL